MPCHKCVNQKYFNGSHHIGCKNPPSKVEELPNGSPETREIAKKIIIEAKNKYPDTTIVLRCIWGGSGTFPMYYDPSTVLACSNENVIGEPKKENPLETILAILMNEGK